jgi:putative addiction module killer protein
MITFVRSEVFRKWLLRLQDRKARARILTRLDSAVLGNFGDCQFIGEGVYEMRINFGPGYRVYYTRRAQLVYLLLVGGDKSTQKRDIQQALEMNRHI